MIDQQLIELFKSLPSHQKEQLIYESLMDDSLSFTRLSSLYVETLEVKAERQQDLLVDAFTALGMSWNSISKRDKHSRQLAAEVILKSGFFKGAPIHDQCVEYNLDSLCSVCRRQIPCECG